MNIAAFAVPTLEGAVWVVVLVVPHVGGKSAVWRLLGSRQRQALRMFGRTEWPSRAMKYGMEV